MSDNQHLSSSDRISDDATKRYTRASVKVGHQKPPAPAPKPKPKPKPRKRPVDEDVVLKNFNDMLDIEEGNVYSNIKEIENLSPTPDGGNINDEEEPVTENLACVKAVESETSDYRSDSRGSIDDDVTHTAACSVADGNMALSKETCVTSDHSEKEV